MSYPLWQDGRMIYDLRYAIYERVASARRSR
jgi:hypothetical protein